MLFVVSCSNKKNTAITRAYHSVNTRYNVHFNANEAYKEAMKSYERQQELDENLSQMLYIYPEVLDSADMESRGSFKTTIEKTTKAIKLHSIKTRPRRDPDKRGDKKYQEWVKRKEFNPFLVNTWMLLAKAEFQEGSYLRAITTFMYITKIYSYDKKVVSESKLWIARAYSEMGWRYEAENVLRKMEQNDEIHHELLGMYTSIKANLYVRNKEYKNAIPYLEEAIEQGDNGYQKRRNKYLLGQLYTETGEKDKAYKAFGSARGFNSPYNYTINTKLRQIEVSGESQTKLISELKKLTKGQRNEEYLDVVYTALGNVYLNASDTVKAIENYSLAVEKSKKNGYDKALAQIKLGGLHFDRKEYIQAQPHYSGALSQLKKTDENYAEVSLRSEVLDQLVVHAKVVHEQDSLLLVANMPEAERLAYIEAHIEKLKKEEERKAKEEELEQRKELYSQSEYTGWDNLNAQQPKDPFTNAVGQKDASDFYFYNKSAVEQGKITFQQKWGKRALEDNWRRRDKSTTSLFGDDENEDEQLADKDEPTKEGAASEKEEVVTDQYSVEYYLQQLPLTEEAKEESYKLIENALFNMGLIYKNLLEDNELAIETFETDLKRFPDTPNKEEIYYQLFLIYLRMENEPLMTLYRNLVISEFPSSKYAAPLSDSNYAWNFKYMAKLQEELYQETYQAYLAGDVKKVRQNYESIQTKFPFVSLMPKFAFLNSLSYAQTKDARNLEKNLTKLISDYPQADVTPMATNILKNIKDGMILLSDGSPIIGMDWTMAYSNDSIFEGEGARAIEYRVDLNEPHTLLLMFTPKSIDRNELLYQVADYNFSNYVIQTYDLKFNDSPILSSLEITGFDDFKTIKSYISKAFEEEGLMTKLDAEIIPVPMSVKNYADIYPRLGLEQYMQFYTDSLGAETPQLLAYWNHEDANLLALSEQVVPEEVKVEEVEQEEDKEEPEIVVPETNEEKIILSKEPVKRPDKEKAYNDKEVTLEDALSEDQMKLLGDVNKKSDDIIEGIQGLVDNPVEGLKNIFNRNSLDENLTKEEKAEKKRLEKEEKERKKAIERALKAQADSIARVEKFRMDSINRVEQAIQDSIDTAKKQEADRIKQDRKDREQKQKELEENKRKELQDKEDARKQQLREREERRKQQERERQELLRQRERERDELQKRREEERRQREKEAEELRKQKERERRELQKNRENTR